MKKAGTNLLRQYQFLTLFIYGGYVEKQNED